MTFSYGKLSDPMNDILDIILRARVLAFDFDGTLVDSNPIK